MTDQHQDRTKGVEVNLQAEDPVVDFWQRLVDEVREETPEEDREEHDRFWGEVFSEYEGSTNNSSR
jgi:hypothetical protein